MKYQEVVDRFEKDAKPGNTGVGDNSITITIHTNRWGSNTLFAQGDRNGLRYFASWPIKGQLPQRTADYHSGSGKDANIQWYGISEEELENIQFAE